MAVEDSKIWIRSVNTIDNQILANYQVDKNSDSYIALKKLLSINESKNLETLISKIEEELPYASIFADWADRKIIK